LCGGSEAAAWSSLPAAVTPGAAPPDGAAEATKFEPHMVMVVLPMARDTVTEVTFKVQGSRFRV
jgi:hypothetical protein